MNKLEKKKPSYFLIFIMGFLTGVLCTVINPIFNHWPAIKAAIAKWWN